MALQGTDLTHHLHTAALQLFSSLAIMLNHHRSAAQRGWCCLRPGVDSSQPLNPDPDRITKNSKEEDISFPLLNNQPPAEICRVVQNHNEHRRKPILSTHPSSCFPSSSITRLTVKQATEPQRPSSKSHAMSCHLPFSHSLHVPSCVT